MHAPADFFDDLILINEFTTGDAVGINKGFVCPIGLTWLAYRTALPRSRGPRSICPLPLLLMSQPIEGGPTENMQLERRMMGITRTDEKGTLTL